MNNQVYITETILRDAHQSLIATRMRTEDMLPICSELDQMGYWSLEVWGGATFDACLRYLEEDPWERLHLLKKALPNTRLQMLLRGQNLVGYRHYADDVVRAFVLKAAENGIDVFRIFDALNDLRNLKTAIDAVKEANKHAQGVICYTTSPVHTTRQFADKARSLELMGCDSIAIKDMAGLLRPAIIEELLDELHSSISIPIHLHTHSTSGQAEMVHWQAIKSGCRHLDTALSAFSGGPSHPATEGLIAALQGTAYDTLIDLGRARKISEYFSKIRKKYHEYEISFETVDTRVFVNQVPGGMVSNLVNQLKDQNALDRLPEVLEEIPNVRKDMGYPPLVTPTSQIIGTQAVFNILTNQRYQTITNEVKLYLQGMYGAPPGPIDSNLREKAIGNKSIIYGRPADMLPDEMEAFRERISVLSDNEEDILTYALFPEIGKKFLESRKYGVQFNRIDEKKPVPQSTSKHDQTPIEFNATLHGERYHIRITGSGHGHNSERPYYLTVDGLSEEVMIEVIDEISTTDTGKPSFHSSPTDSKRRRPTTLGQISTSIPGTIVEILVEKGVTIKAGEPVLIIEAMKMETEIPATIDGRVTDILVKKGDRVNPDETLLEIRP